MIKSAVHVCAHAQRIRPWPVEERPSGSIGIIEIHPIKILINEAGRLKKISCGRRINAEGDRPLITKEAKKVLTEASVVGCLDSPGPDPSLTITRSSIPANRHRNEAGKGREQQPYARLSVPAQQLAGGVKAGQRHVSRQKRSGVGQRG